jgi:cellulose synthase/poly-beta-1,6-N-acetylglucosamine synthase-like glycosyltransferase
LAFEPSDKADESLEAKSEVREPSPSPRAANGFAEANALFRTIPDLPSELRPLNNLVDPVFLRWAAARAETLDVSGLAIVRRSGVIHPDAVLAAYAAHLGAGIDLLEHTGTTALHATEILSGGVLPAESPETEGGPTIALLDHNTKGLCERLSTRPALAQKIRITSAERLRAFIERSCAAKLSEETAFGLMRERPLLSAGTKHFASARTALLAASAAAAAAIYLAPGPLLLGLQIVLATVFLSWSFLRVFACFAKRHHRKKSNIEDRDLPLYTVLVPLHREANIVFELVEAISALNYPREKLDVKLVLEPDDTETIAAVNAINLDPCFEIIFAPVEGPRTKPKALRAALPFARGQYLVVYDAEDRPHPDQLRDAYARFLAGGERLACVQAKLAIDNAYSSFLSAHFRAEYSGLFDVLLPALVRLRLPIPLGGSSNHFEMKALRKAGTWDPHNVTEDADLGIRFARFGYTTDYVDSTTWEEAPVQFSAWLPQRTRWMKGWLQTYMVHMRTPHTLLRQLGIRGFIAFQLLIGGSVLAALVHPVFVAWLLAEAAFGSLLVHADTAAQWAQKALIFVTLINGYLASGLLAFSGMRRRGLALSVSVLLTIPFYWLLLSAAAWRAVWKLITAPYEWEKTAHGVAERNRD